MAVLEADWKNHRCIRPTGHGRAGNAARACARACGRLGRRRYNTGAVPSLRQRAEVEFGQQAIWPKAKRKGQEEMSDIAERVRKIVVEHLGVEADKVTESAGFIDDLGADSLDTVELVMAFEDEFGVEIPDDAAEKILTVADAINFIRDNSK